MNLESENQIESEEFSSEVFLKTFSKKIKHYDSLFISSFPQKINPMELINYSSHAETKFMEFDLTSQELISDLSTLTAHLTCRVREQTEDGTIVNLPPGTTVGAIPGSILNNAVRNLRVFLYNTQISPEKSNRYSLLSYIFEYFNKANVAPKGINYLNGSYFDQAEENFLVTSEGKAISKANLDAEVISQGFYESGEFFKLSASNVFMDRINSPFLFSNLNLLLNTIKLKIGIEVRGSDESGFILRYDNSTNSSLDGRKFLFIVDDFHLSLLRLRPLERIKSKIHRLLSHQLHFPLINMKLHETILIR